MSTISHIIDSLWKSTAFLQQKYDVRHPSSLPGCQSNPYVLFSCISNDLLDWRSDLFFAADHAQDCDLGKTVETDGQSRPPDAP
jgi:hypothetical protein